MLILIDPFPDGDGSVGNDIFFEKSLLVSEGLYGDSWIMHQAMVLTSPLGLEP